MIFASEQLNILYFLKSLRSPLLDSFFRFLQYFDTPYFFFFIMPFLWLLISGRVGVRLLYIAILSGFTNDLLKGIFAIPRPFVSYPDLIFTQVSGYSFPSGAAQITVLLSGMILYHYRKKWVYPFLAIYVLLIGFSRMYLAVHYPIDILAGWCVGGILLTLYIKTYLPLETYLYRLRPHKRLLLIGSFFLLAAALFKGSSSSLAMLGCGLTVGMYGLDRLKWNTYPPRSILIAATQIALAWCIEIGVLWLLQVPRVYYHAGMYLKPFLIGLLVILLLTAMSVGFYKTKKEKAL